MYAHEGSGSQIDRWFAEGIGLVQEVVEHHGTFGEYHRQLLSATINGKTQKFQLTEPSQLGRSKAGIFFVCNKGTPKVSTTF